MIVEVRSWQQEASPTGERGRWMLPGWRRLTQQGREVGWIAAGFTVCVLDGAVVVAAVVIVVVVVVVVAVVMVWVG